MTLPFVIGMVLFEAALLASLFQVRKLWRGEASNYDPRPLRVKRTAPVSIGGAIVLVPLVLATGAFGDTEKATILSAVLVAATLLWLLFVCVFVTTVYLAGRPSSFVPPRLRRR
jgi:uncharacterized membrane protein